MFATWFVVGLGACCTIVGIPIGYQAIKVSFFLLFPFGKTLTYTTSNSTGMNILNFFLNVVWATTVGWFLALEAIVSGILLTVTIIGIPFGWQCFKLAHIAFRPFGLNYSALQQTTVSIPLDAKQQ